MIPCGVSIEDAWSGWRWTSASGGDMVHTPEICGWNGSGEASGRYTHASFDLPQSWCTSAHEHPALSLPAPTLPGHRVGLPRARPALAWHLMVLADVVFPGEYRAVLFAGAAGIFLRKDCTT